MKLLLPFAILFFIITNSYAQTLVQQKWTDTSGTAGYKNNYVTGATDDDGNIYIVNNVHSSLLLDRFAITKYDPDGNQLWQTVYDNMPDSASYCTNITLDETGIYVTGFKTDSTSSYAHMLAVRLDLDGNIQWVRTYKGAYGGYDIGTSILVAADSFPHTPNVYVEGTEQIGDSLYEYTIIKYDTTGSLLWVTHYDSVGLYNIPVGLVAGAINHGQIATMGVSGSSYSHWDFQPININKATGQVFIRNRLSNVYGNFTSVAGIQSTLYGGINIVGTTDSLGFNPHIKIVQYDNTLNYLWSQEFYTPGAIATTASSAAFDPLTGFLAVSAIAVKPNGGHDAVTLAYSADLDGTLIWNQTVSAPNPTQIAMANDIAIDDSDNVYVTGAITQGGHLNYLTHSYNATGNIRWLKTYSRCSTCNDVAKAILLDSDGNPIVSGISMGLSDTTYATVAYEQTTTSTSFAASPSGSPLYMKQQILVKFDTSVVNRDAVNDPNLKFGDASTFLKGDAAAYFGTGWKVIKMFDGLKTTDTISISRLGERIPIPTFWSAFLMNYEDLPETIRSSTDEIYMCSYLRHNLPFVESAELDRVAEPTDVIPDDADYPNQLSISPTANPYGSDINVEEAWNYTTGKSFVKVGMFDSGLYLNHEDFYPSYFPPVVPGGNRTPRGISVAKGGWDFMHNDSLGKVTGFTDDLFGHGTRGAGIIGAVRNNSIDVAGIAGGDSSINPGVSLYGFQIFFDDPLGRTDSFIRASTFIPALVRIASFTPDTLYGFGMDIINQSFALTTNDTFTYNPDSSSWPLLVDAYRFTNRNKVILPTSTGNAGDPSFPESNHIEYPAALDDDWILAVGATGIDGNYCGCDGYESNYGYGIDISAPGTNSLITTLGPNDGNNHPNGVIVSFGGTSAAAPHVSGVAALLLSYLNDSLPSYNNLAPEDVEFAIEHSAFNTDSVGYNLLTGWGRLNAGGALSIVDTAKRKLIHFDSDSLGITNSYSLITPNQLMSLTEQIKNDSGKVIQKRVNFKADVYRVTCPFILPLDSTQNIAAMWTRASSSYTYPPLFNDTFLIPHAKLSIQDTGKASATAVGYIYHLYDSVTHQSKGWLPFDTAKSTSANFAISALIGDSILTPWNVTNNTSVTTDYSKLKVYPNPTYDYSILEVSTNCQENVTISLYNLDGEELQTIFNGNLVGNKKLTCHTGSLSSGIYFITMQSGCETKTLKLLKF